DDEHVMYVWFDALVSYISTLGWPDQKEEFEKWWPGVQIAGKDNVRQQAAMWQAMLCSVGLPFSEQVLINGFINVDGQKMSKSLGNVITPKEMVEKFGTDGTRYLLLTLAHLGEDSDISWERATEKYNADLANGLGNLVSRVIKLSEKMAKYPTYETVGNTAEITNCNVFEYAEKVMEQVREANEYMSKEEPWMLVKNDNPAFEGVMNVLLDKLGIIASQIEILMPETAEKIELALKTGKTEPLFQRI
ncbi:MAG: class I tRNA ligase family protein, partial [Patescibacteria group bacterium]